MTDLSKNVSNNTNFNEFFISKGSFLNSRQLEKRLVLLTIWLEHLNLLNGPIARFHRCGCALAKFGIQHCLITKYYLPYQCSSCISTVPNVCACLSSFVTFLIAFLSQSFLLFRNILLHDALTIATINNYESPGENKTISFYLFLHLTILA